LVVGCIPVLKNGNILMVSASKKAEWILPKGGWELDESMEESAIRETFEEAGVIGVLGPKLSEHKYETRKARLKRLSFEEKLKKGNAEVPDSEFSSGWSDVSQLSEYDHLLTEKVAEEQTNGDSSKSENPKKTGVHVTFQESSETSEIPLVDGGVDVGKMRQVLSSDKVGPFDEISSDSSFSYTHVLLNLFPLYVTEVKDAWPESRRVRRAMNIDEAIERLERRPEMRSILSELRNKGLHLV